MRDLAEQDLVIDDDSSNGWDDDYVDDELLLDDDDIDNTVVVTSNTISFGSITNKNDENNINKNIVNMSTTNNNSSSDNFTSQKQTQPTHSQPSQQYLRPSRIPSNSSSPAIKVSMPSNGSSAFHPSSTTNQTDHPTTMADPNEAGTSSKFVLGSSVGLGSFWQRIAATAAPSVEKKVVDCVDSSLSIARPEVPTQQELPDGADVVPQNQNGHINTILPPDDKDILNVVEDSVDDVVVEGNNGWENDYFAEDDEFHDIVHPMGDEFSEDEILFSTASSCGSVTPPRRVIGNHKNDPVVAPPVGPSVQPHPYSQVPHEKHPPDAEANNKQLQEYGQKHELRHSIVVDNEEMIEIQRQLEHSQQRVKNMELQSGQQVSDLQRQLHAAQVELMAFRAGASTPTITNGQHVSNINTTILDELRIRHEEQLNEQYKLLDEKNQLIQTLQTSEQSLRDDKLQLQQELYRCYQETIPTMQDELHAITAERDVMEQDLMESHYVVESVRGIISELQNENSDTISSLSKQISEMQISINEKERQIQNISNQLQTAASTIQMEDDQVIQLMDEKQDLLHQLQDIQAAFDNLQHYHQEAQLQMQSSNEVIVEQSKVVRELQMKLDDVTDQLQVMSSDKHHNDVSCFTNSQQATGEQATEGTDSITNNGANLVDALVSKLQQGCDSINQDDIQRLIQVIDERTSSNGSRDIDRETEVERLQRELVAEKQSELDDMMMKINVLNDEKRQLSDHTQHLQEECTVLKSNIDAIALSKSVAEAKASKRLEEINDLHQQFSQRDVDYQNQWNENETRRSAELETLRVEFDTLEASLAGQTNDNIDLSRKVEYLTHEKDELLSKLHASEEHRSNAEIAASQTKEAMEPLRRELQKVCADYEHSESERQKSTKHLVDLSKALKRVEEQSMGYLNQINQLEHQILLLTKERDDSSNQLMDVSDQFRNLEMLYDRAVQELDIERRKQQQEEQRSSSKMEIEITELRKEYDDQIWLMKSRMEKYKTTIHELQQQIEDNQSVYENTMNQLRTETDQIRVDSMNASRDREIAVAYEGLQDEYDKLKSENEELYVQFAWLNDEYEKAKRQMLGLEENKQRGDANESADLEEVRHQNLMLQEQVEAGNSHCAELTSLAHALIDERDTLLKHVQELEELAEASNDNAKIAAESGSDGSGIEALDHLQEKCRKQQQEIVHLQQQLQNLHNDIATDRKSRLAEESNTRKVEELEKMCQQLQADVRSARNSEDEAKSEMASRIASMKKQIDSLGDDLFQSKQLLSSKDQQLEQVDAELRSIQEKYQKMIDEQDAKRTMIGSEKDVGSLRAYVVTLAQALEHSESKRAEAVNQLAAERETNADSLRRMGKAMKQFYSTVAYVGGASNTNGGTNTGSGIDGVPDH